MTENSKKEYRNYDDLVIEQFSSDPSLANDFLEYSIAEYEKDGDEKLLLLALKQVTLSKGGFQELSKNTGLSRESLYKTLSINGNPRLSTLQKILKALDYGIYFKHIEA